MTENAGHCILYNIYRCCYTY